MFSVIALQLTPDYLSPAWSTQLQCRSPHGKMKMAIG